MIGALTTCLCGEPLRPGANFCVRCGREIRQACPACFDERRLIANRDAGASPWCDNRGEVLVACARCGRWLTAASQQCPDPGCRGSASLTWPANTGRAVDGAGRAEAWRWPAAWDRLNPQYAAPKQDAWHSDSLVHCAFVAHGRLYVWAETSLLAPEGPVGGQLAGLDQGSASVPWRCWLGLDGQPDPNIPFGDRAALVGGGAVLAAQNAFLLAGLYPRRTDDAIPLNIGRPLQQGASEAWWVGWSRHLDRPALWLAPVPGNWRGLACEQIADVPPQSVPVKHSSLVLSGDLACWIGEDQAIWQLDCRCRELRRLTEPLSGVQRVWYGPAGLYAVWSAGHALRIGMVGPANAGGAREVVSDAGALRDLFASRTLVAIVGETVAALDMRTGDTTEGGRYSGRWIAGALADPQPGAADQETRLLMLTEDAGYGNLAALRLSSGAEEPIWREAGVRPLALIPAGESLYLVHEGGVNRIQEALQ